MNETTIIIGAGLSGLTAAYTLYKAGRPVLVLEAGDQPGGLIRSDLQAGYRIEGGPHTFPGTASELRALCGELGLAPQAANPQAKKRYLYLHEKLQALPQSPIAALTTPLLSWTGKRQLLGEPSRPKTRADDISIAAFIRQRLGVEVAEHFVDPFVSGIYAGDIEELSLPAVFPRLWQWEQEAGSILKGALRARRTTQSSRRNDTHPHGGTAHETKQNYRFYSFSEGMAALPQALAKGLPPENLRLHASVTAIQKTETGFSVALTSGEALACGNLILAVPADAAAHLLKALCPVVTNALAPIPYNGLAVVHSGFDRKAFSHPLDGFGFLIPRREKIALLGSIWVSSLFPERAPAGKVLFANFIGGAHRPEIINWRDDAIARQVLADLSRIFRTPPQKLQPDFLSVHCYGRAIPQYTLGHRERIEKIETALPPGLAVCGNYLHGVALNECVKSGQAAAQKILKSDYSRT